MAEMYTPEEIQEIFQAYNDAIKSGTPISQDLAKAMQDAQKGVKGWTDSTNAAMKKLGTSVTDLTRNIYKGGNAVNNFGDTIETASSAVGLLILALGPFSMAAKVAALAVTAFGKAVNVAGKQADALFKTYQDLNKAGATTAGGLQDVFVQMQGLGYGIEELDRMVQLVTQNSEALAKFSQTAGRGVNAFSSAMTDLNRDPMLRALGKLPDDINSAGASFIRQSVRAGLNQTQVGDQLAAQTRKYILDLDRLQRLTGISADALQRQQEEAMAEDAYNQVMSELRARATAGDQVAQAQIEKITTIMSKLGPEMRKEFVLGVGGDITAMQRLFMTAPSLLKNTMDETVSTQQAINDVNRDFKRTIDSVGAGFKLGAASFRETFGPLSELRETMVATADFDERVKAAKADAIVTDKATQNMAILQLENMRARDALQSFVQLGVHPATRALKNLAEVAAGGASTLPGKGPGAAATPVRPGSTSYIDRIDRAAEQKAGGYFDKVIRAESGGRNIANQSGPGGTATSSAFGLAQITKGTFEGLVAKAGTGNPLYGKTFEDMKADVGLQKEALRQLTDQNRLFLSGAGLSTSDAALYLAHFLGPAGAARVLGSSDTTPIQDVVSTSALMANPNLQKMTTVADLKQWADQKMGGGGYRFGGIATGPTSGYQTMLHGTEAIVPLPNGKTIPVEMPGFTATLNDQSNLMTRQIEKLDNLIDVMRRQVDVSNKILQRTS